VAVTIAVVVSMTVAVAAFLQYTPLAFGRA